MHHIACLHIITWSTMSCCRCNCKAEKRKPGDAFLAAGKTSMQYKETAAAAAAAKPALEPSNLTPAIPVSLPDDSTLNEKFESIVAPSDRRALRKVGCLAHGSCLDLFGQKNSV